MINDFLVFVCLSEARRIHVDQVVVEPMPVFHFMHQLHRRLQLFRLRRVFQIFVRVVILYRIPEGIGGLCHTAIIFFHNGRF